MHAHHGNGVVAIVKFSREIPRRATKEMGVYDSSLTRVVPIFDRLYDIDCSGLAWLPELLKMGDRSADVARLPSHPRLIPGHERTWGSAELAMSAPVSLLEYLIQNLTVEQVAKAGDTGRVREQREALARKDQHYIAQAIASLREARRGREWFVLEGDSRPDATLIMEEAVLVVEGKRTERTCTSKTKWMGTRSQLLRHMDAAMARFPGKRVLGLLLVEGQGGVAAVSVSHYWLAQSRSQFAPAMLASSLPHRTARQLSGVCLPRAFLESPHGKPSVRDSNSRGRPTRTLRRIQQKSDRELRGTAGQRTRQV
jgi:hypothetical protein